VLLAQLRQPCASALAEQHAPSVYSSSLCTAAAAQCSARCSLLALKLLRESESWDRGGKLWVLPPTLHPPALARGMEAFLRVVVQHPVAAMSQEVNAFLGNLALTAAPQGSPATSASDVISDVGGENGSTAGATASTAAAAAATAAAAVAVEAGHFFADDSEEEAALDAETAYVAARALPSARPELRDVVSDAGSSSFAVRGAQYLTDRRKVSAGASALQLLHADIFEVDAAAGRVDHIALHGRAARRLRAFDFEGESAPFVFIVNFQVRPAILDTC
jgi:Protein ENHANCED DISEASE RESISTANCE 2, C-terminal